MLANSAQTSDIIEDIAQRKAKYEKLYREKQTVIRADPAQAEQLSSKFFMMKCLGQTSFDDPKCRLAILGRFESDTEIVPASFEDNLKIHEAAHAILTYIVSAQISEQPVAIQQRIITRALELKCVFATPKSS
ncbi:hypothetical protein SCP_0607850 [Sparassis crispa]|uniref:Uncharacterized protein n=1 Tax=Sparassis crispa TaxID=139825 RepID=A0A401GRG1_9APHY|nr:hypothetical protein SCP_0607850 [Sparassis crispa]GBE84805.1 hypothetical protein SCP_0607850 [Sparassis crispa]